MEAMYGGMTRNELRGLTALIVLIALGMGAQAWVRWHRAGLVWEEESLAPKAHAATRSEPARPPDLNRATAAELETLPGIGPVTARAIADTRNRTGPFRSIEDLSRVPGIGAGTIDRLRGHVAITAPLDTPPSTRPTASSAEAAKDSESAPAPTLVPEPTAPQRIDINSASVEELQTLWNVGPKTAEKIVAWREANGGFHEPRDLIEVHGIGVKTFERNRHRIRVEPVRQK